VPLRLRAPDRPGRPVRPVRLLVGLGVVLLAGVTVVACGGADQTRVPGRAVPYCDTLERMGALDLLDDVAPAEVRRDLTRLLALTRRAAREAPPEIRADAEAAVAAQVRFNDLYAAFGWDPDAVNRDRTFIDFANSPDLGSLYVRLQGYQDRVCGPRARELGPDAA